LSQTEFAVARGQHVADVAGPDVMALDDGLAVDPAAPQTRREKEW